MYLVEPRSRVAHIAKMGTASVYSIGREPSKPENGEVLCGKKPKWWAVATVDLVGFGTDQEPDYDECWKCHHLQFGAQRRLTIEVRVRRGLARRRSPFGHPYRSTGMTSSCVISTLPDWPDPRWSLMPVGFYRPGVQSKAHDNFVRFQEWDLLEHCGGDDGTPCFWDDAPGESSCLMHNLMRVKEYRTAPVVILEREG